MFTGIIESLGTIVSVEYGNDDGGNSAVIVLQCGSLDIDSITIGDSIAVNGACLTVTEIYLSDRSLGFDVSAETLAKCLISGWRAGDRVNLESALTLQKPLGGHLVSGHVDGVGILQERRDADQFTCMRFKTTRAIGRYIAVKGSITVDGISLTSNQVEDLDDDTVFDVTIVPHTLKVTSLETLAEHSAVHLEIDMLARYIERLNASDQNLQ